MSTNPLLLADFPDPDVIRVNDTYYMISTTMHFMPGGVILRSFDLIHWEIHHYLYDILDKTEARTLKGSKAIYGQGMWAASLRYHQGTFYVIFCCNDNRTTYVYRAESITGPWQHHILQGFYHDNSLIFDDDRIFIVYGNTDIRLTELNQELTAPKEGGVDKVLFTDTANIGLGYEGAHIQKIKGKYYISLIHWPSDGTQRRLQAVKVADHIEGPYTGGDVLDDDMGFHNMGVAQGGLIDTPQGDWYALLFQDRGALGRIPILVPVSWKEDYPVLGIDGRVPRDLQIESTRPEHEYQPFVFSDDFRYQPDKEGYNRLRKGWEWNHIPHAALWSIDAVRGSFRLKTDRVVNNLTMAPNTLTMRSVAPGCSASVSLDGRQLNPGDLAGICALQGKYGLIALTRESDRYYLIMLEKPGKADWTMGKTYDRDRGVERGRVKVAGPEVEIKVSLDFEDMKDQAEFFYLQEGKWNKLGITKKLYFGLDHFCGVRFGLFLFSTESPGGSAEFRNYRYQSMENS